MVNGMSIPRSKRDEKEIVAFHVGHTRSSNNHYSEFALFQTYSTTFNPSMFANFSGFDFLRAVSTFRERKKNSCLVLKHDI